MAVRAFKARLICNGPTLDMLWRTHCVFNEKLVPVIKRFNELKRGEDKTHPNHARAYMWGVLRQESKRAYDRVIKAASGSKKNSTAKNWFQKEEAKIRDALKDNDASTMKKMELITTELARERARNLQLYREAFDLFVGGWRPLSELRDELICLPKMIETKLYQKAVEIISGHEELTRIWKAEHDEWLDDREKWKADSEHRKYLEVQPLFEKFEKEVGGTIRARRGRWHRYLDFLRSNPILAGWRGKEAVIYELDDAALERVRRARRSKQRSVEAEEFWERNKELRALDRLHGEYEKKFARRGRKKRNPDGFKHRPTFTLPSPTLHQQWFEFNAPQTNPTGWRALQLPPAPGTLGSVELELLASDPADDKYPTKKVVVTFKADPRLSDFSRLEEPVKKGTKTYRYKWYDRHLRESRLASIGALKLMFHISRDGTPKMAFLVFPCDIESLPVTGRAKQVKDEFYVDLTKLGKKRFKDRKAPPGLISLAVDIGIRHVAFATLARWNGKNIEFLRARNIRIDSPQTGSPELRRIDRHKRILRLRRRERGAPIKGEKSHVQLQSHITKMAEDRFKKAARAIINFALNTDCDIDAKTGQPYPRADIIIIEHLGKLKPDATYERGVNRQIATFNHGHIIEQIERLVSDVGLKVKKVSAWASSQICHRCGSLGVRYAVEREIPQSGARSIPIIRFGGSRPLFACSNCKALSPSKKHLPFTCNADFNGAANHQRRFYLGSSAVSGFEADKDERIAQVKVLETTLAPLLRELHGLSLSATEPPW